MAYVSKELVSKVREALKREFPKFKFLVSGTGQGTLNVVIKSGPIRFIDDVGRTRTNINHYHLGNYYNADILQKIIEVCNRDNYDNSQPEYDYFDVGYYLSIHQGRWDKPYVVTE